MLLLPKIEKNMATREQIEALKIDENFFGQAFPYTWLQVFSFFITEDQIKMLPLKFRSGSAERVLTIMRELRSPVYPIFP